MAIEKVRAYFRQLGEEARIIEPEAETATVELAASNAHSAVRVTPEELYGFAYTYGWVDIHKDNS